MKLEAGVGYLTEWYKNNDGSMVRDFTLRDFGNWIWVVKQFAKHEDATQVGMNMAFQLNPNSGELVLREVDGICNKALRKDDPLYAELQFSHDCNCCN
jgi:hypothetical protein